MRLGGVHARDHVCAFVDSPSDGHRIVTGFARAGLDAGDTVRVHMGGLRFIDVGSLGEIMAAARPPRRLVLHEPPGIVLRMIAVLWPDSDVEVRYA